MDIFRGAGALLFEVLARLFTAWARGGYPWQLNTLYLMPIYKFRGDRAECDNYHGISLLPPVGRLFSKCFEARLLADPAATRAFG